MRARAAAALGVAMVFALRPAVGAQAAIDGAATASSAFPGTLGSAGDAAADPGTGAALRAAGVPLAVTIDAPADLKALLDRHLDLARLGRMARDDVDDSEWSRLVAATPAQVRELLQTEGYFRPQVAVRRMPDGVRVEVMPGSRAHVQNVTIAVEGDLDLAVQSGDAHALATLAQVRSNFELPAGSGFRNPAWGSAKSAALARLRGAGYATASWRSTAADVEAETATVQLALVADSGPLFRYGALQIEGLVAQSAATVEHLLAAQRGVPVTDALLLDFQDRLQKSGLFEHIGVTLDTDPAQAAAATIVVRLGEAPLQTYTFGVGISANTGPRASVEHYGRRVAGRAMSSHNKIEIGQKRQHWEGELSTHPGDRLYRNLVGGAIENLESDSDTVLSQRLRVGRTRDTQRLERLVFVEAERSRRETVAGVRTQAVALSLNLHGGWRGLDSVLLPTQGATLALQLGGGHSRGTDAVAGPFGRAYGRLTVYQPLGRAWYSQARIEIGRVYLRAGGVAPESQKFRAGGDESVRGYGYRTLGPIVDGAVGSGTALATASFEVARPLSDKLPALWGALFVDTGHAADSFGALDPATGLGVGVRWRSPVGPLRLDYAWGLETRKPRLHFSVGIAF